MAQVVLVHGIAQEQESADSLERDWVPDLAGGVREAGCAQVADRLLGRHSTDQPIEVRMAFFGGLFRDQGEEIQGSTNVEMSVEDEVAEALAREWLANLAERSGDPGERRGAEDSLALVRSTPEDEQGAGEIARRAISFLGQRRYFAPLGFDLAQRLGNRALGQVSAYLGDDRVRQDALARVAGLIDDRTTVIVGHSLGSVVAYEAAWQLARPLALLITLGSPLGLETIVYDNVRPRPPGFPPQVVRWVNVADREDMIAAEPDLRRLFPAPPGRLPIEGVLIDNGAKPHSAASYLTSTSVGRPIGEALAAA